MESKQQLLSPQQVPRRRHTLSRKLCILLASLLALIVVALAVGLGVGLTRRHTTTDAGSSTSSTSSNSTSSSNSTMGVVPSKYGIWQPPVNASWQIVLYDPLAVNMSSNTLIPDVDVWDIDMFTNSNATVTHLHALGKRVVCYFSAGSYEPGRPDSSQFTDADKGGELSGWPGEYWLNISDANVRSIMANRIYYASTMGCDAIDPDNVDGYGNTENGLGLTEQDSIDYIGFLSDTAAQYNISIGLKNAGDIISSVMDKVHFSINEQCVANDECSVYQPFIAANKPVFHIEYPKGTTTSTYTAVTGSAATDPCSTSGDATGSSGFSTTLKNIDLDGWVQYCSGLVVTTPCTGASGLSSYS